MDFKWIVLVVVFLIAVMNHQVDAEIESRPEIWSSKNKDPKSRLGKHNAWDDLFKKYYMDDSKSEERESETEFYYNHHFPSKPEEIEEHDLKCTPGRTTITLSEKEAPAASGSSDDEEDLSLRFLRSHMNTGIKEEYCKVCVCSVEGKDEYCSGRPAMNVNECIRLSTLMNDYNNNMPFDHTRTLAYRIRRDFIWHNDEIPYQAKAKCKRGSSYYSNSVTANDTDIDVASDVDSLLSYSNMSICFYCVCSLSGAQVSCILRNTFFCEYYRKLALRDSVRDRYTKLFQQDRPSYFRHLSWRLRRTMDQKLFEFTAAVGGDDPNQSACVPFVSEYTDCNAENQCNGCTKCLCVADGKWSCTRVRMCGNDDADVDVDRDSFNDAMQTIENSLATFNREDAATSKTPYVPRPPERTPDLLLDTSGEMDADYSLATFMRNKRSHDTSNKTDAIQFYHTVDEINEDTLKSGNLSGTLEVHKVDVVKTPKAFRRTGVLTRDNLNQSSLHIAFNSQKAHDPHLADNKIEADQHDDPYDSLSRDRIHTVIGNHTQKQKDKDLSKLVVNELTPGHEIIGDKNAKITSNITFKPENDTLTAMTFIAGNLLNKLWNMEKDSNEDSIETESLKHEKIADLLDLFKEPLNMRQENFLKSALEQLSEAIDKDKNLKNVSLCEKIEETKKHLRAENNLYDEDTTENNIKNVSNITEINEQSTEKNLEVVTEAITKINNVLSLINKFQKVQKDLGKLKQKSNDINRSIIKKVYKDVTESKKETLTQEESSSLNVFGNILEKITKLLLPPKKSKKMVKNIRNQNVLKKSEDITKTLKNLYNIDIDSSDLSPKDKVVFDYLSTVKRNSKCILDNLKGSNQNSIAKTEGDILLNLSEFFKVKSFVDLLKLVEPVTKISIRTGVVATTIGPEVTTEMRTTTISTTTEVAKKLTETKEKLKAHLKNIIDDLVEIQIARGHSTSNVSIIDALPCIYKILNVDKNSHDKLDIKTTTVSTVNKVVTILNSLKQELLANPTRRTGVIDGERPKSAVVWERIIKNVNGKNKLQTRRNLEIREPKSFEELKKLMDKPESGSKIYKTDALTVGVPVQERLVLLKALYEDVKDYLNVLEEIDNSMTGFKTFSLDQKTDLNDFVINAAADINLSHNIVKNIDNLKVTNNSLHGFGPKMASYKKPKEYFMQRQSMTRLDVNPSYPTQERNNVKLSRDSVINQLIKNRMQSFIKLKESQNLDLEGDINYSIAKKIISYLESGNYILARDLYKIIVSQKHRPADTSNGFSGSSKDKQTSIMPKEPVVQFVEPRGQSQLQWLNQDIWLKQLSNLKSMRV